MGNGRGISRGDRNRNARLVDHHQVLTDACVLLCGHTGALKLLELGYTGPLARRPRLAACARSKASRRAYAARATTDLVHRK